ncbi:MAG: hypothetical protein AAF901_00340 [Bacteroidota bacterium]
MNGTHPVSGQYYHANPQVLNYDNYSVTGQGILKKIQPYAYEFGPLNGNSVTAKPSGRNVYFSYPFQKQLGNQSNNIYFHDVVSEDSYLKINSTNWGVPATLNDITDITAGGTMSASLGGQLGYDGNSKRRYTGTFIESYTNEEIRNNPSLVYEASNFERYTNNQGNLVLNYPAKGIGAFKVTVADGKTYHYALPVYHYEMITRGYDQLEGEDSKFNEVQRLTPYATHWLLTAITGPDFVDTNSNGTVDDQDHGYWVTFDYGRWTDSFLWAKEAKDNGRVRGRVNVFEDEEEENVVKSMGIKQLYYLNAINTRTHSALFLKSQRLDNVGESYTKTWTYNDVNRSLIIDDQQLATGIYFTNADFTYTTNISSSPSLKLDKIILVDRDNLSNFNLNHTQTPTSNSSSNSMVMHVNADKYSLIQYLGSISENIHSRQWTSGNYTNNVYLTSNYSQTLINDNTLSAIDFDYSYALVRKLGETNGKLTLNKVSNSGKNNVSLIPPYEFSYYNSTLVNDDEDFDLWGYYKTNPKNWSLRSILSPTGNTLEIEYERDDFKTILMDQNAMSNSEMTPVPKSFERLNNGYKGKLKLINTNPCYEIGEIYSCLNVGNTVELTFERTGYSTLVTNATVTSMYDDYIEVNFTSQIPSHFSGDFFIVNHQGGSSRYAVDMSVADCGSEQSIGKCNDSRGGIRVSRIRNQDMNGDVIVTKYDYLNPVTGQSSGMTAQTPYVDFPYLRGIIPGPGVLYEYVSVATMDGNEEYDKTIYRFNSLQPLGYEVGSVLCNGCQSAYSDKVIDQIGDFLKVEYDKDYLSTNIQNNNYDEDRINMLDVKIYDNYALLGTLKEMWSVNSEQQTLYKEVYDYSNDPFGDKLGTSGESFKTYQVYETYPGNQFSPSIAEYFLTKTSLLRNSAVIESVTSTSDSYSDTVSYTSRDFLTGDVLETISEDSKGQRLRAEITPAYHIAEYSSGAYSMASKVDDITNRNMLTQEALTKSYIEVDNQWKETGVGITTWNNNWQYVDRFGVTYQAGSAGEKIWLKHKNYVWDGDLNPDGTYAGFIGTDDSFDWTVAPVGSETSQSNLEWKNTLTTTRYNHFSKPIEIRDINNNYASTRMGDDDSKVMSTTNVKYGEAIYVGGEYANESNLSIASWMRNSSMAHTGDYSITVPNGTYYYLKLKIPVADYSSGTYKVSVWAHKNSYQSLRFKVYNMSNPSQSFNGETLFAGDWVLMNHYVSVYNFGGDLELFLHGDGASIPIDDLRVHPISSTMTSYVYNQWDELEAILDANNLATRFEYDSQGRLKRTYSEVIDTPGMTGGFKINTENDYHYKLQN